MNDEYQYDVDRVFAPSRNLVAVTPSDVTPLSTACKGIYVGTGGNITLRAMDDSADVLLKNVPTGAILPIRLQYVKATGTTATDIVAFL